VLWAVDTTRNPVGAPYLASALTALIPVPRSGLGTFAVDRHWRIYLDPERTASWTIPEIAAVGIHEVHHLLRDHAARGDAIGLSPASAVLANQCQDAEINGDLTGHPLPGMPVTASLLGQPPGMPWEVYYRRLAFGQGRTGRAETVADCGSGAIGLERPYELPVDHRVGAITGLAADRILDDTAHAVLMTVSGTVPAGVERWARNRVRPVVDWRRTLSRAIRAGLVRRGSGTDYTYSRPSRRHPPGPVLHPSTRTPVPNVAVVVDTSGSIDQAALDLFLAEVDGIISAAGGRARVLAVDAHVHTDAVVRSSRQVVLRGGGGTDMPTGITRATTTRPHADLIVVLTDGHTPWPARPPAATPVVVALHGRSAPAPPRWAQPVTVPCISGLGWSTVA
jgi:predicted metal-dependent peptidase